jgi:hypothetical protein
MSKKHFKYMHYQCSHRTLGEWYEFSNSDEFPEAVRRFDALSWELTRVEEELERVRRYNPNSPKLEELVRKYKQTKTKHNAAWKRLQSLVELSLPAKDSAGYGVRIVDEYSWDKKVL